MVVEGIETTLPLFRALVREPAIIDGDYHIHWLEQYLAGQPPAESGQPSPGPDSKIV
jgi:acetyl-CoA carboxylase, biotin carboxylase subunit